MSCSIFCLLQQNSLHAQIARVTDWNTISWFQLGAEIEFNKKWGLHIDINSRYVDFVNDNMQKLFRTGVNFKASEKILVRAGFVFAMNSPYGDYTVNAYGKPFNERRLFEMVSISDKIGTINIEHRFVLEQRWGEKYSKPEIEEPDETSYQNRIRYRIRLQKPFLKNNHKGNYPYLLFYDEIMISFGNEVNANIFDQNRIAFLLGYRFNQFVRLEAGYLNQIAQLPRRVDNNNVFQHNNGLQVNLLLTIPTSKDIN
ncbi:DUF2490 domain-containing protein [Flavihumibacter fluvii]|uniref:DUF2490 domain-containing protein n=1 Tax=Flavihumibacter fluvii TaxID=2838157 RepID=UPI001EFA8EB0|nr:DUF2490 domain-containing protein [Flavihumibacter fluvii]ULQ54830.1 DUF2490 domain-containing protein [Flavihumibacter fluvii]